MSYWPGELVQTLSINGNQLSINPGNTVTLPGGGSSTSSFNQASISSLTVSSINGVKPENLDVAAWASFPASQTINANSNILYNVSQIQGSQNQPFPITSYGAVPMILQANGTTAVTIESNASTTVSGLLTAQAGISTNNINLSTINGLAYTPGITSTISTFNELYTSSLNASTVTTNTLTAISTINVISTISTAQIQTDNVFTSSLITSSIAAQDININFNFNANNTTTSTLNVVSTTNLASGTVFGNMEFKSTLYASSISATNLTTTGNTIFTDSYSGTQTVGGPAFFGSSINMTGSGNYLEIGKNNIRVLAPTIGYNDVYLEANLKVGNPAALTGPDIEFYPNEFTMGDALHPISGGISMTAGSLISFTSPLINMLGANVAIGAGNIIVGSGAIEVGAGNITIGTSASAGGGMNVYGGKIFAAPSAIGPPSGGNGGIVVQDTADLQTNAIRNGNFGYLLIESQTPGSNNVSINDISQLTSDGAGMLQQNIGQIIGNASNFAITNVSSINGSAYPPSFAVPSNLSVSTLNVNNGSGNFNTNGAGTTITVPSTVTITNALIQENNNFSTIQRFSQVMLPNLGDVEFAYDIIPPGFPSTTMGKLIFSSTINGGSGGVKIQSQFGDAKQLAVNGDGVYASDLVVGSNSDYPITTIVPDLDEWSILGLSTIGGGVGKTGILVTTNTNTGQLAITAPNTSNGGSTRIMWLDSSNSAVGINNGNPTHALDVVGDIVGTGTIQTNTGEFSTISCINNANVSSLTTQAITLTTSSFVSPTSILNTTSFGSLLEAYDNLGVPAGYITSLTAIDATPSLRGKAFINMVNSISSIGICKTPDPGTTLDVEGIARAKVWEASTVQTSQVFAPSTFVNVQSGTGVVSLTPAPGWFAEVNSGTVAGDQQGLIKFGQSEINITGYNGGENYIANQIYPGYWDGTAWTNYTGRAVRVEYPITMDTSFPAGNGQAQFVLPVGISTLTSFQGTYVGFQDNDPAFNHPVWLYSTINDANGQISTIQVGGEQNATVFVSVVGYV